MNVMILGGGGVIGSAAAACLAWHGTVDTIYILDRNRNMMESHVMDLSQAAFPYSKTRIQSGGWPDLAHCQMLIVAIGLPASAATHDACQDIASLMPAITEIAQAMARYNPGVCVLSMTNPLDIFNYTLYHTARLPARQFLGLSQNDTLRFQWALAQRAGCRPEQVSCWVAGEHGPGKIPLFSAAAIDGVPVNYSPEEQAAVRAEMNDWWQRFLDVSGARTAGWTSGASAALVVETVAGLRKGPIACSVILEEGQGYSMGWPVELDRAGVASAVPLKLTAEEEKSLAAARETLKASQERVLAYLAAHAL